MSKEDFTIDIIDRKHCVDILMMHHYLTGVSKTFRSGINFGLFYHGEIVGVAIYTPFSVSELVVGAFGLPRNQQSGMYELSRFCMLPNIQKNEHNISSWFLSRTLKTMKTEYFARAILSYADSEYHSGTLYAACNFKYYGLTDKRRDFYIETDDGNFIKHSRGKVSDKAGKWVPRSQKHRFLICFDNNLKVKWIEHKWIKNANNNHR